MRISPRSWVKPLLFLLGLSILVWMIMSADPVQLWNQLLQMGWTTIGGCIAVWGIAYVLNSLSWNAIVEALSGRRISLVPMLRYTISGYALNYITPMGLLGGEPYRVWALKPSIGIEKATSSVLLYAMMHFCSHFLFWIIGCLVAWLTLSQLSVTIHVILAVVTVLSSLLLLLFLKGYRSGLVMQILGFLSRLPWLGKKVEQWQNREESTLIRIDEGIASLLASHRSSFVVSLGFEVLARLVCCVELMLASRAIGLEYGYFDCLLISAFSSLLANLLFFSPLQMGTREGGIALAFVLVSGGGVSAAGSFMFGAVALSMATRIREFVWIAVGGVLSLFGREKN